MPKETPAVALRRKRLQQWIDEKFDGVQAQFVKKTGINQGELSLLLKTKSFGEKRAQTLEEAAGMPPGYLSWDVDDRDLTMQVSMGEKNSNYVRVHHLDGDAGMGSERINDDYPEVIKSMDFTPEFIRSVVGFIPSPGRLVLITGRGDSMLPTIQPGESLIVDTGVASYDTDGLYLVNLGNGQQIKRLVDHGADEGIFVHSDNPVYPKIALPRGAIIGGKVYLRNRIDRFN